MATQPAEAAKRATATMPIVMPNHSDLVATGILASLSRPGGNATGLSIQNPELTGKRLELLKGRVSTVSYAAVLWNPTHKAHPRMLSDAQTAARGLRIRMLQVSARGAADYEGAFSAMRREGVDALLVLGDVYFWRDRAQIAALAAKNRLPTMFAQREHVEAGGLMHYGPDLRDSYRRAAAYVDKILRGAKPGDLPIEQPTNDPRARGRPSHHAAQDLRAPNFTLQRAGARVARSSAAERGVSVTRVDDGTSVMRQTA